MMGIDLNLWIIGLLLFAGAAIFLFTIQASFTGGDDSVKKRLIQLQKERAATQKEVAPEWEKLIKEEEAKQRIDISRVIAKVTGASYVERLDRSLAEADIPMRCSEYLLMRLLLIVAPLLLFGFVFRNIMIGAFLAVVALLVPPLIVKSRSRARIDKFNNQLAEFLVLLVNALRAGQTFLQAVNHAIKESPEPIASEFKLLIQETNLGLPVEAAFQNLVQRVPSPDLDITATAFLIQKNIGGNLAEVMEKVAATIRERVKLQGQIRVLTAQGALSGWIVGLLPIGLGFVLYGMNPDYIGLLFSTEKGRLLLGVGATMQLIGVLMIRKIITIDV